MKKISTKSILLISLVLIFLLSLSVSSSQKLQGLAVSLLQPLWKTVNVKRQNKTNEKITELELENMLLKERLSEYSELGQHNLNTEIDIALARVILRSPISWNSSLWISVGERDNEKIGKKIIAKNSPVVVGRSLIGVVELVQKSRSRIRLITDPDFTPSVRAIRNEEDKTLHLAKGELHGSAKTMWRSRGTLLIGEGFNYDYDDEYGPARDLRSNPPILKVGDLLATTGMDGVFPAGLHVAKVTKIQSLREGDYYYEIEALPTAKNIEDVTLVHVLPPL